MEHKGWHSRHYLPHFDSQDVVADHVRSLEEIVVLAQ